MRPGESKSDYQLAEYWRLLFGGSNTSAWAVVNPETNLPIWISPQSYATKKVRPNERDLLRS
jgi:hypothetical protein